MRKECLNLLMILSVLASLCLASMAFAEADSNFNARFDQGIQAATALQGKALHEMQNFKPEKVIERYDSHPKESNYQNNPDPLKAIKNDADIARNSDKTAKAINDSIYTHPKYDLDLGSPQMAAIQQRTDNAYEVLTKQFGDCTKQTSCTTVYETKICEEAPKSRYQYCQKSLIVDLVPKQVDTHYPLTLRISTKEHSYAGASVNAVDGHINFVGPHEASFFLDGRLPGGIDCHGLHGNIVHVTSNNPGTHIDYVNFPSCSGMNVDFHVSGSGNVNIQIQVDIISSKIVTEQIDRWEDGCSGLEKSDHCTLKESHCVAPKSIHDIQGTPVTRDCWEQEESFQCGGSGETNCQIYHDQGCEQTNSVCENQQDGICSLYRQTFQCPTKTCTDTGVICNGETYCLSGDCVKQNKQADPDFQRGISGLSAVDEAAKSYVKNVGAEFPIFSGVVKTCNKDFLNFVDCCSDSGWGIDLNLGHCDPEAQELGEAKKNGLVVYVDREDNCPIGGFCSHKKKYCVFPSKLARIIQEQGRRDQLHVLFGNFNHPDCRGLAPDELSNLNLNKVDFSDFYADIAAKNHMDEMGNIQNRLNEKMTKWVQEKKPHG